MRLFLWIALLVLLAAGCEQPDSLSPTPSVLAFTATWCGPCRFNEPRLQAIEAEGYPVTRIDADESPDKLQQYGVRTVPTYIVFNGSIEVLRTNSIVKLERTLHSFP